MKLKLTAKLTQIDMVRDRGYLIPANELLISTNVKKYKDVTFNNVYINEHTEESLYVHFFNPKIPIKDIEVFVEEGVYHDKTMLIGIDKIDKKQQDTINKLGLIPVEVFTIEDLLYNVTHSIYVPKHEKINNFTAAKINELPTLLTYDPVIRYYGWQPGDIIKVHRYFPDLALLSNEQIGYCVVKSHL